MNVAEKSRIGQAELQRQHEAQQAHEQNAREGIPLYQTSRNQSERR